MRKIALLLTGILVVSIPLFTAGCGQKAASEADGPSTVRIFGPNRESNPGNKKLSMSDWYTGTVPSRIWDTLVAELAKRGVKLELDLIEIDQVSTVFQTILASGKFNDYDMVTLGWNASQTLASDLYSQNRLYAWNKAIEQYSAGPAKDYYFNSDTGKFFAKLQTLEDGNFYWINDVADTYYKDPSYSICSFQSGIIRWDWLQAVGLGIPKTLDEFSNALVTFQQRDINGNGVKDEVAEISMSGFRTGVAQWFGLGTDLVSVIDYKAVSPWYQSHIQDYINYMNRLYKAGVIRVDSEGGAMQANRIAFKNDYASATWNEPGIIVPSGAAKAHFAPFVLQAMPDTPAGIWQQPGRLVDWVPYFIPARAKNIEGAVRIIDYTVTKDFAILSESGIEGYTFRYDSDGIIVEGEPNPNNVGLDVELFGTAAPALFVAGGLLPRNMITDMRQEVEMVRSQGYQLRGDFLEAAYDKTWPFITHSGAVQAFPTTGETERITTISPDLNTYSSELLASLIMGEKSLADWNTYMSDLKRLGLDELIGINQARIDRAR